MKKTGAVKLTGPDMWRCGLDLINIGCSGDNLELLERIERTFGPVGGNMNDFIDKQEQDAFAVLKGLPEISELETADSYLHGFALGNLGCDPKQYGELMERFVETFRPGAAERPETPRSYRKRAREFRQLLTTD